MTKLTFAIAGAAALTLTLAGCGGSNEDALNTAEVNQANEKFLDAMAGNAAADAANAEAAALGTQEQQLEQENAAAGTNPTDADEQNVAGM